MHRNVIAVNLIGILAMISPAYGYLDPGTGSIILQGILGTIAMLVVTGKLWWHKLLTLFGMRKQKAEEKQGESKEE